MTQEKAVLEYLKTGKTLSPLEALDKFGCFRLASIIHSLKQDGHQIETSEGVSHRDGKKKRFGVYRLVKLAPDKQLTF